MDTVELSVTIVMKNTIQLKESTSKTQTTSLTTAITTRKHGKEYPPPEKKNPRKQIRPVA